MTTGTSEDKMTLILGGNGKTGRRVTERLTKQGLPVRIGSRSGEPPFDWENQTTWLRALQHYEVLVRDLLSVNQELT